MDRPGDVFGGRTESGSWYGEVFTVQDVDPPVPDCRDRRQPSPHLVIALDAGGIRCTSPVQFDESPPELRPAPEIGQHTEEVLLELGISWDEVAAHKRAGAIS